MAHITLCAPINPSLTAFSLFERDTTDMTWISDGLGFHYPHDLRDHELMTIEVDADNQDERLAFWHAYVKAMS